MILNWFPSMLQKKLFSCLRLHLNVKATDITVIITYRDFVFRPHIHHSSCFSVLLGLFFSAFLSGLRHHFEQWQQNWHTHGQEEWDVDGKLLVIRKVEEVEEWRVKEGSLWCQDGLFTVLQSKAEVPGLQLSHSQLQWRDSTGHLSDRNNNPKLDTTEEVTKTE